MASKVSIWNMALVNMGSSGFIQSPDELTAEANHFRVVYDNAVEAALEDADWNFASRKEALADLGTPDSGWGFQYAYPSFCVKAREIVTSTRQSKPLPFKVSLNSDGTAKVINTDIEAAVLRYTSRVTNTALFTAAFAEAVSWKLALLVGGPLNGNDVKIFEKLRAGYAIALAQAQSSDANEGQEDDPDEASWIKEYE